MAEPISIYNSAPLTIGKTKVTDIGGIAILVTNKTGGDSVAGEVVKPNTAIANSVILSATSDDDIIGVFLDSGVPDGSEAWVVVSGIAYVKANASGFSKGDRIVASATTAGRVDEGNSPSTAVHFTEIGHALEDAAANTTGKVALHFN